MITIATFLSLHFSDLEWLLKGFRLDGDQEQHFQRLRELTRDQFCELAVNQTDDANPFLLRVWAATDQPERRGTDTLGYRVSLRSDDLRLLAHFVLVVAVRMGVNYEVQISGSLCLSSEDNLRFAEGTRRKALKLGAAWYVAMEQYSL